MSSNNDKPGCLKRFLAIVAAIVAAIGLLLGRLFDWGPGGGDGGRNSSAQTSDEEQAIDNTETDDAVVVIDDTDEEEPSLIFEYTIVVKKGVYIVNNEEKTLDEINEELLEIDREKINITLVDKYASAKAWEEIIDYLKTNGFNYGEK